MHIHLHPTQSEDPSHTPAPYQSTPCKQTADASTHHCLSLHQQNPQRTHW